MKPANGKPNVDRAVSPILFAIVQDRGAKPREQRQPALALARYFLPRLTMAKKPRRKSPTPDECGFVVDPNLAREFRDLKLELACLRLASKKRSPHIVARRAAKIQERISEIQQQLDCPCPSRYRLTRHLPNGPAREIRKVR